MPDHRERITKTVEMSGEPVEIYMTKMMTPCTSEEFKAMSVEERETAKVQPPLNQRTYSPEEGIVCMQDIPVKMRDGVTIYADIYKPEAEGRYPLIISWSFYGKRPFDGQSEWQIMGVPPQTVSNMSKFESPDPGYWCRRGYAVANVDPRGIGHSEGDFVQFGSQDGKDGYDFIEWAAKQSWCSGRCALSGNSCVAMTQWRIASQQPPHLTCMAPWESTTDMYRESLCEGGIPAHSFVRLVMKEACGPNYMDSTPDNLEKYPFIDCAYWKDKDPVWENVTIPVYQTACWNHFHLRGSINAFRKCRSRRKWLRVHRDFEWPDAYSNENLKDLELFFARYLKLERNGWELTPKVRIEVQDTGEFLTMKNRPEENFPLKRTKYEKLYLDASDRSMKKEPVEKTAMAVYESETGEVWFDYRFEEDTELTGYMKLRLHVAAESYNDMDLFIAVQKLSTKGDLLPVTLFGEPHPGAWGKMRVSRRKLDEKLSTDYCPVQAHIYDEKLKPGQIVPVDIEIVPTSRFFHKGQQIRVSIAGRYIRGDWFEPLMWNSDNQGNHLIYTGGEYDSFLQIPVIPPRFQDGDFIIR
ncbi:CocE/NonD family hydrolase [Clostridium boliviensis]|uniref:CocE/NonD family hydrolase n=1 Tax=Clostridium boliviensis TaxID=318465 RepID=A0ABU4GFG6_9CLOT|nr:CocE/NonD family hydrolase [Clostridium boliviensis]MDW2796374.1 CocE/NonD family hydrolase [Clostridium boliviensis]